MDRNIEDSRSYTAITSPSIVNFSGVRGYELNGVAYLHIEDVSRGLGLTRERNGVKYVMWDRVKQYLEDINFHTSVENEKTHDFYIPENIFYRLCMKARNDIAEAFQAKVADDIIPSIRKTGSYMMIPKTYAEALRAYADEVEKRERVEAERDEAIRTKSLIGSRREATAMATASACSRQNKRLVSENAALKDAVGRGTNWRTVSMMRAEWIREFGHAPIWQKLKQFSADVKIEPVKDVEERVVLPNGGEQVKLSYRYHKEAWNRYREYEENLKNHSSI